MRKRKPGKGVDDFSFFATMLDALLFTKTPALLKAIYPDCIWHVKTNKKVLYLTFDDGPIPDVTPFVLNELKKWDAKATFFCIGKNAEAQPEIFQRIINEGHAIGNHTYNHLNGWNCHDKEYLENIRHCAELLESKLKTQNSKLFRPPYGKLKPSQYAELKTGYKLIMWDVLSFDFDLKISAEKVLKNVLKHAEAGSIVVMHDSLKAKPRVEYALPKILEHFTEEGFNFEAIC